ncbi:hypothetical protein NQ315_007623 [Exocentrus adspersus]|uniref:Nose resistant-to-fluoxetine protein N-terminal domain-containing protein n=1 Tax=Exocentrus adspersus TaxID=1586481 RepID=A0AAV8W865_9CUCU|nr:hypothetical protein NQ315_007623 [Exocentrus adspersus]
MKLAFLLFVVLGVQTTTSQLPPLNTTVENLTNLLVSLGYNSTTVTEVLTSDVFQQTLGLFGYPQLATSLEDIMDFLNKSKYIFEEIVAADDECSRQLVILFTSLENFEEWALKMLDATAKIQSGILVGNMMHVGNFDECLSIDTAINNSQINGQYCTAYITHGLQDKLNLRDKQSVTSLKLSLGLCIPAACNTTSLETIARLVEQSLESPYHLNFVEEYCKSTVKTRRFSFRSIAAMFFFTAMGVVVALSTLYDVYFFQKHQSQGPNIFVAFSFYTNGRKLFSTKKSADSLACLNGLRVLSLAWIVLGHRFMYLSFLPLVNLLDVLEWLSREGSGIITASNMGVDVFFLISGLLLVYVYLLHKEKGHTPPLSMFYLHRILRLTPTLAAMVLFYSTLLEYIGFGPFWAAVTFIFQGACEENWWSTLLYIQNYVNPDNMCLGQSWYLAVDTQLYFLSPIILFPLLKWPKRTISVIVCLIVTLSTLSFGISWQKDLSPAFYGIEDDEMKYLYAVTHVRATTWLLGVILGYTLFRIRDRKLKQLFSTTKKVSGIGESVRVSRLEAALANSLIRLAWSMAISVIILLCVKGHGGVFNKFLSSSIFTVLIRINYNIYLIHIAVILYCLGNQKSTVYGSFVDVIYSFWGDYIISAVLAVVWTLTFESPILVLEKIFFGNRSQKNSPVQNGVTVVVVNNLELDVKSS